MQDQSQPQLQQQAQQTQGYLTSSPAVQLQQQPLALQSGVPPQAGALPQAVPTQALAGQLPQCVQQQSDSNLSAASYHSSGGASDEHPIHSTEQVGSERK